MHTLLNDIRSVYYDLNYKRLLHASDATVFKKKHLYTGGLNILYMHTILNDIYSVCIMA